MRKARQVIQAAFWVSGIVAMHLASGNLAAQTDDLYGLRLIAVATEAEALDLEAQIRAGTSFEILALERSIDVSASASGYLGRVNPNQLRPEYRAALADLAPGEISPIIALDGRFILIEWMIPEEVVWRESITGARRALRSGRYSQAEALYRTAVETAEGFGPDDRRLTQSLTGLAETYRRQDNPAAAAPLLRRSLSTLERILEPQHPDRMTILRALAAVEQELGDFSEVERLYRQALTARWDEGEDQSSRVVELLENLAALQTFAFFTNTERDPAVAEFNESLARAPANANLYLAIAAILLEADLGDIAEQVMLEAVRAFPGSRDVRAALAEIHTESGNYLQALAVFEEASRIDSPPGTDQATDRASLSQIQAQIGRLNIELRRFEEAEAALRQASDTDPENLEAILAIGNLFLTQNKLPEALAAFSGVIESDPRLAAAHSGLAEANLRLARFSESAGAAARALELDPELQTARYTRAMALIRDGQSETGESELATYQQRQALIQADSDSSLSFWYINRGAVDLLREGETEDAIESLSNGIATHPEAWVLYFNLGLTQSGLGRHGAAIEAFETLLEMELGPRLLVHRRLSSEYEAMGDVASSQRHRALYLRDYDAELAARLD